jgi:hypothetical protein
MSSSQYTDDTGNCGNDGGGHAHDHPSTVNARATSRSDILIIQPFL